MAIKTVLEIPLTGADDRNAIAAVQSRLAGVIVTGDPVTIARTGNSLQIQFDDVTPDNEINAALRTLANLADRPGSGIGRGYTFTAGYDANAEGLQREFSR